MSSVLFWRMGGLMSRGFTINQVQIDQVFAKLQQHNLSCSHENIQALCPELTGDQIYVVIEYLTGAGRIYQTPQAGNSLSVSGSDNGVGL